MAGFRPRRGLQNDIGRSLQLRRIVETQAEKAAAEAQRIAKQNAYDTGAYHDSIHPDVQLIDGKWVGVVAADDFKAAWIELGVAHRPPTATLRRAALSLNLRFVRRRR